MIIELKDIAREGTSVERVLELGSLKGEGEERIPVSPTQIRALLTRGRRGIDFDCRLDSSLQLTCVRCLEPFAFPVAGDFHLVFVPSSGAQKAGERQLDDEDCEVYPVKDSRVELDQVVREQLYLSIPLKPLCREDCQGLCATCGANLNAGACACPAAPAEPTTLAPFPRLTRSE